MLAFAVGSVELLLAIKGARDQVFFYYYLVVYTTGQSYRAGCDGKGGVDKIQTWCFIVHDGRSWCVQVMSLLGVALRACVRF